MGRPLPLLVNVPDGLHADDLSAVNLHHGVVGRFVGHVDRVVAIDLDLLGLTVNRERLDGLGRGGPA